MCLTGRWPVNALLAGLLATSTACTTEPVDGATDGADDGADDGDASDDGGDADGDDGGDGSGGSACTTGTLFAGNPLYDGDELPDPSGIGILEDPPVQWREVVFDGDRIFTHTGEDLWVADMAAASPQVVRFAGQRDADQFNDGTCAAARLANTQGMARLPDGGLVVADYNANALVKVTDPAGPACAVSYLAGTSMPLDPVPFDVPNQGDTDGPGATAQFRGVKWPVADEAGVVYFVDEANRKVKKVATDAASTVSTVASLAELDVDTWTGMTRMNGKLYLVGIGVSDNFVIEVDPAGGAVRTLVQGRGDAFPPLDSGQSPILAAVAGNGTSLYVSGNGYIWQVSLDGDVELVAGTGFHLDFPPDGYDPAAEHPALELALKFNIGQGSSQGTSHFMSYHEGALYFTGINAVGYYVEKIDCE
jgi:hypothetical protein